MSKMDVSDCLKATQERIAELAYQKKVSQKHLSELLGLSPSYIRNVTNNHSAPSLKSLFAIMNYFDMDPAEFFSTITDINSPYNQLCQRIRRLDGDYFKLLVAYVDMLEEVSRRS